MGALVERARFVRDAAGNKPPETGEGLEVQVVLQPPCCHVGPDPVACQRPYRGQIVADDRGSRLRSQGPERHQIPAAIWPCVRLGMETPSGGGPSLGRSGAPGLATFPPGRGRRPERGGGAPSGR